MEEMCRSNARQFARKIQYIAPIKVNAPIMPTFDKSLTIRSKEVALPQPIPRSGNLWKYPKASATLHARSKPEPELYLFRIASLRTFLTIGIEVTDTRIIATKATLEVVAHFNPRAKDMARMRKSTVNSITASISRLKYAVEDVQRINMTRILLL